jgi:hypothetical protein
MDWGEIVFFLLALASVFVLVVVVFVLKSIKKIDNENVSPKQGQ